jgi:hypothetical protein
LSPGRHTLEAWRHETYAGSNEVPGDVTTSDKSSGANSSRSGECRTVNSFEVAATGSPAATRLRAEGVVLPGYDEDGNDNEVVDEDGEAYADADDDADALAVRDGRLALFFVTGASQRYVDAHILQNLIGSLHFWEPRAAIEVWDFGLSAAARIQVAAWRRVRLKTLPLLTPPPAANASFEAAERTAGAVSGGSERTVPEHLHVAGFGAYAAKAWATRDSLRRWSSIARRRSSRSSVAALVYVFWIDANCELRRPLHGTSLPYRLATRGGFFVTHPYGFPSPQFHFPATVAALGCPAAADPAAAAAGATAAGTAASVRPRQIGVVTVPLGSLRHCATTFMGFTLSSPQGRAVARHVLDPLVACSLDPQCIHPQGSSRTNHRQEQTALNAILCNLSHGNIATPAASVEGPPAESNRLAVSSGDAVAAVRSGAGSSHDEKEVSAAAAWNLSAATLCDDDVRFRLTSDFENRANPLQPTGDPHDWNDMALYTRRGHPHKPYLAHLQHKPSRSQPSAAGY